MTPAPTEQPNGVLLVDKDPGFTSHNAVALCRRILQTKKVGHCGTLDPEATGVLPVMLGGATRFLEFLPTTPKQYRAVMKLGVVTDTLDLTGTVLETRDVSAGREEVLSALGRFRGDILQVPPMYSAVKINGVPCYKLARKGKEVERKARHVAVLDYEITRIDLAAAEVDFRVHCTKGFYVRTYAHDIGQRLGCGAHLTALRRIRSGHFDIAEAVDVPTLKAAGREELLARLLPVEKVLADRA